MLLKKILITLTLLIFLSIALLWMLKNIISPDYIKQLISEKISAVTKEPTRVHGEVRWQIFPRPFVLVKGLEIGREHSESGRHASIASLALKPRIMPLLSGNFVADGLVISQMKAQIKLHSKPAMPAKKALAHQAQSNMRHQLHIKKLDIKDSEIAIDKQGQQLLLKSFNLHSDHLKMGGKAIPFNVTTHLSIEKKHLQFDSSIDFHGRFDLPATLDNQIIENPSLLNLQGQLGLQDININRLHMSRLNGSLNFKNKRFTLNPLTFSLYEGQSLGFLEYDSVNDVLNIEQTGTGLNSKALAYDLSGHNFLIAKMDYALHATMPLNSNAGMKASGQLHLKNGVLKGIDLNYMIDSLVKKTNQVLDMEKINIPNALALADFDLARIYQGDTAFKLSNIDWTLEHNLLESNEIIFQSERFKLHGQGVIDLNTQTIKAKLKAIITDMRENDQVLKAQRLLGGSFPILIQGSVFKPDILPDVEAMYPSISNYLLKHKLNKGIDKLKDKLGDLFQ